MSLVGRGTDLLERARGLGRAVAGLKLRTETEYAVLAHVANVASAMPMELKPGVFATLAEPQHISGDVMIARLAGRTAGATPEWHDGSGGALMSGVHISRVGSAIHLPDYGAVITSEGHVLKSTIAQALFLTPSLAALPGVTRSGGEPSLSLKRGVPVIDRAAVFLAWGGRFNYGHFLIDCLTALAALDEAGLLTRWRPVAPLLNSWQKEALQLFLGRKNTDQVRELSASAVYIDDVVFASPMDHFLHAPNRPLDRVRERMLAAVDEPHTGVSRLYVNRRSDLKRPLVNEDELEQALIARGFVSVAPETLSVSRQIALFRDADVIVAPTGAALANVLFCKPQARVYEIQPTNYVGIWVRGIAQFVGAHWHGFFAPSPLSEREIKIEGVVKDGMQFRWRVSVGDILAWIDNEAASDDAPRAAQI